MCGITGFLAQSAEQQAIDLRQTVKRMASTLSHRGPDDSGEWVDAPSGIALGFRRLSIIDITPAGHQPMESASGRYVIIFNGEVYNFERIRKELVDQNLAPSFRGHSDTEVMLAAFEAWGVEESVKRFIGMFAIALWDRRERKLHLIRDRVGVKPLYYGWYGDTLLFGSELKALRAHPAFRQEIDRDALALFLRYTYIPAPFSIYEDTFKLLPGTILTIAADAPRSTEVPVWGQALPTGFTRYWSAVEVAEKRQLFQGSEEEAVQELDALLRDSVALRMISDVPLGVFLSGGVDSSTVVAMMQLQSARPVKTFAIGFHEKRYDEAPFARAVAQHLGTDHHELYVTSDEAMAVIPSLPHLYDEPFADSSQIPTHLVSALARRHVTVSLSGDGGDELFGGYTRYGLGQRIWNAVSWLPASIRPVVADLIGAASVERWDQIGGLIPSTIRPARLGAKAHKVRELLVGRSPDLMYRDLMSAWKDPTTVVKGSRESVTAMFDASTWLRIEPLQERMMLLDLVAYLPDDILVKVDRASMGVSLEAREPLLDHRLIEFAWSLPLSLKIRRGAGKWILRKVLNRYVPKHLIERPKTGFEMPVDGWLRGALRPWAESLLDEKRLESEGFFDPAPVRRRWLEHLSGAVKSDPHLWTVLMFQSWLDHQKDLPATTSAEGALVAS